MTQAKIEPKVQAKATEFSSAPLLHLAGYGLLLLSFFDVVSVFVPPQFTNPNWEFQLLGNLVERTPVPLMGAVLVFYGGKANRSRPERFLLPLFSWASLLAGVLYILLIPLGFMNAWRIDQANIRQISAQVNQRMTGINKFKDQLKTAKPTDINSAFEALKKRGLPEDIKNPKDLKTKITENIVTMEQKLGTESETTQSSLRINLLKNAAKWNLGALVSGVLFILIWRMTRWARRRDYA